MKIEGVNYVQELIEPQIVRVFIREHAELRPDDVKEVYTNNQRHFGNNHYAVLIVAGDYATITNEARKTTADLDKQGDRIAKAMVVRSAAHRIVGNFYIRMNRPKTPTKVFDAEEKARQWLMEKVKSHSAESRYTAV